MTKEEWADTCEDAANELKCHDCEGECSLSKADKCLTMKLMELAEKLRTGEV